MRLSFASKLLHTILQPSSAGHVHPSIYGLLPKGMFQHGGGGGSGINQQRTNNNRPNNNVSATDGDNLDNDEDEDFTTSSPHTPRTICETSKTVVTKNSNTTTKTTGVTDIGGDDCNSWSCAAGSQCKMPGEPIPTNFRDPSKPKHCCFIGGCGAPMHAICAGAEYGGHLVCIGCTDNLTKSNDVISADSTPTATVENAENESKPSANSESPTIYIHKGEVVKNPDNNVQDETVIFDFDLTVENRMLNQNVSTIPHKVDEKELSSILKFLKLDEPPPEISKLLEKKLYINLHAEDIIIEIGKLMKDSLQFWEQYGSEHDGKHSFSYHPDTVKERTKLFPLKNDNIDSNSSGSTVRYWVADTDKYTWFMAIFDEIVNMLRGSYSRYVRGLWYLISSLVGEDNQVTKTVFDQMICEVCNMTGLSRNRMNLIISPTEMATCPIEFVREQEELEISIDGVKRKVIRLKEVWDFKSPTKLTHAFVNDREGVDSKHVHFKCRCQSRASVPRYTLAVESLEVASNLFAQPDMISYPGTSGAILYYGGVPKAYGRFFMFCMHKLVDAMPMVSCKYDMICCVAWLNILTFLFYIVLYKPVDVNPMGVRGGNQYHLPIGSVDKCIVNVPESRYRVDSTVWIGPFPQDAIELNDFSSINKKWKKNDNSFITKQLANKKDGNSFISYGPDTQAREEALKLMQKKEINVEAESFDNLTALLFKRAWAVVVKKQGWQGKMGM